MQHLLSNRTRIKEASNYFEKEYRGVSPYGGLISTNEMTTEIGYEDPKIENDEYNDLILIESAIENLADKGVLSNEDLEVIEFVKDGNIFFSGDTGFDKGKVTMSKRFENLCERIAFYMGGYFTNDGFIDHIATKYDRTTEDVAKIRDFIQSRYRHIRRK